MMLFAHKYFSESIVLLTPNIARHLRSSDAYVEKRSKNAQFTMHNS